MRNHIQAAHTAPQVPWTMDGSLSLFPPPCFLTRLYYPFPQAMSRWFALVSTVLLHVQVIQYYAAVSQAPLAATRKSSLKQFSYYYYYYIEVCLEFNNFQGFSFSSRSLKGLWGQFLTHSITDQRYTYTNLHQSTHQPKGTKNPKS